MRLFNELLQQIASHLPMPVLQSKQFELLSGLNTDKFYVENVRSLLGLSTWQARFICESAVRQNLFERWVELKSPDGTIAAEAPSEDALPPTIEWLVEKDGEYEAKEFDSTSLPRNTFYKLHEERTT